MPPFLGEAGGEAADGGQHNAGGDDGVAAEQRPLAEVAREHDGEGGQEAVGGERGAAEKGAGLDGLQDLRDEGVQEAYLVLKLWLFKSLLK